MKARGSFITLKKNIRFMKRILIGLLALLAFSCKQDPASLMQTELVRQKLTSKTWTVNTVIVNGLDQTSKFTGFSISFTNTGFTTTNGNVVWPSSGTWAFANDAASSIVRGDGVEVLINQIDNSVLELEFIWDTTTYGGGRIHSIQGQHIFNLK